LKLPILLATPRRASEITWPAVAGTAVKFVVNPSASIDTYFADTLTAACVVMAMRAASVRCARMVCVGLTLSVAPAVVAHCSPDTFMTPNACVP